MKWPRWSCVKASWKSSSLLISFTIVVVFVFLAALPAYLDEYLLSKNDFCYPTIKKLSPRQNRYLYDDGINVHRRWSITNMILRRLASHLWLNDIDDAIIAMSTNDACENNYADRNDLLHPLCAQYRKLRSQLHFRKLYIPWNWYYRKQSSSLHIRVIGISLRSSTSLLLSSSCATRDDNCYTENENDTTSQPSWEWGIGWIVIHGTRVKDDALVVTTPPPLPIDDNLSNLYQFLPPSFEIKSTNFSIRYPWTRPIISVQMSGITINIIIVRRTTSFTRGGEFFPPRSMNNKKVINEESFSSLSILIGDMTIREALLLLPRPPNVEGLYPRIGIVNVTNVTLCMYEIRSSSSSSSSSVDDVDYGSGSGSGSGSDLSLELLLKFSIPDNVFVPVTNMTLAHEPDGIDMKYFQPLMVESIIHALQQHLLQETTIAFRNSWDTANRAHAQVQQLVLQTQHLYLERWISMGIQAWKKGVVDGKLAPMIRAVEDWLGDIRDIAAEPITPLAAILSHYWNTTLVGILKHSISIDEQLWSYVQNFSDRVMSFKKDTASSNQLHVFGDAIDKFIVKSSKDIELLMKSCEMEVKEMWLDWHRRFHLDVNVVLDD